MATEIDYSEYRDKEPTALQARFAPWITDKTGYNPAGAKTKQEAFEAGVRLAVALRIPFQASDENRAATEQARREREEELAAAREEREQAREAKARERQEAAAAREAERAERAQAKAAKAAAPAAKAEPEPEPTTAAKPVTTRRGAKPAKAAASRAAF